jgi:hypothetical protein
MLLKLQISLNGSQFESFEEIQSKRDDNNERTFGKSLSVFSRLAETLHYVY